MDFNADECTDLRVLRAEYAYIKEQLEQYKSVNDERYSDWQNARDKAQRYDQEMKEKNEELSNLKAAFEESQKSVELISLRLREAAETIKAQGSVEDHTLKAMSDSGASPHIQAVVTSTSAHLFSTKASAFTFPDFQLSNSEPIVLPEARAYRLPSPETSFPAKRTSKAPRGNVLKAREGVTSSSEPRMATRGAMKRKAAEEIAEGRKSEQIEAKDDTGADAASEVTELEDGDKTDKSGFTFSDSTTEKGGFIRFLDCTEDWLEECLGNYFLPQKARIMHPCEVCKREDHTVACCPVKHGVWPVLEGPLAGKYRVRGTKVVMRKRTTAMPDVKVSTWQVFGPEDQVKQPKKTVKFSQVDPPTLPPIRTRKL